MFVKRTCILKVSVCLCFSLLMFLWYWHFISFQFCLPLTLARRLKKRNAMARHRARGSPPVALEAPEFQESKLNSEGQMCRHVVTSCPHVCQCAVLHDCVCCVYIHIRSYPCLVSLSCNSRLREIVWRGCGLMGPLKWKSVDTTCTECRYIDIFIYIYICIFMYIIYIYIEQKLQASASQNSKCLAFALWRKLQATTQENHVCRQLPAKD